ncbi:MAG: hypothetical protein ACP5PX_02690 [Candidatus Hadarchaeum sp.]|uniref:hypothetical protein n=1 Tax=Candidatus Hadarchaeum sp. TaxID=2883567 RepID=UPI003D09A1F5
MKKISLATILFAIAVLVNLLLYIFQPLGNYFYLVSDAAAIVFSFIAFSFGAASLKLHGFRNIKGRPMFFLIAGIFCWFLGEVAWGFYEIFLKVEVPLFSIADFFWLIGYPLFIVGIYFVWSSTRRKIGVKKLASTIMLSAIILIVFYYLSVPTISTPDLSLTEKVSTAGYIICDSVLLVAMIITLFHISGKELFKLWAALLIALVFMSLADVLFAHIFSNYVSNRTIDAVWNLGYLLIAFGFFMYAKNYRVALERAFKIQDKFD